MTRRLLLALLALVPALALAQSPAPAPAAEAPRPGIDYEDLPEAVPTYGQGGIEVAEVFSYACIHCAHFQPYVNAWKKKLAKDVRFEYVPAQFGGVWNNFARAYFAADRLHVVAKTHDAVFKAIHEEQRVRTGSPDEIVDLYAGFGVDRAKFEAALRDPGLEPRMDKARAFAIATGVSGTPTMIVAGKYKVMSTRDRGFDGMLATVDFLVARERAAAKAARAGKKP